MKSILSIFLMVILSLVISIVIFPAYPVIAATTIYVDATNTSDPNENGSQEHPYDTIQEAVDNAASGDTIFVMAGTYHEFVTIGKTLTIEGEDKATTVLECTDVTPKNGISITATKDVHISNLTIRGYARGVAIEDSENITVTGNILSDNNNSSQSVECTGIQTDNSKYCVITGNEISGSEYGVILRNSSTLNQVSGNNFTGNGFALYLNNSTYNEVHGNEIIGNGYGISLQYSANYNSVYGNTINDNSAHGIHLYLSSHNNIYDNKISGNAQNGIFCFNECDDNIFSVNEVLGNGEHGIHINFNCNDNIISENLVEGNDEKGILLFINVHYTDIYRNTIKNNDTSAPNPDGIRVYNSNNTTIYNNNFINNRLSFSSPALMAALSFPLPVGGNHYSDWTTPDLDQNGIVDISRKFGNYNIDEFPYVSPYGWENNQPPVADAGPDQTVDAATIDGADVILDGSGSSDADDDLLTYDWSWDGGTAHGVSPTISLPRGTTTVTLVVNDGTEDSAPDTVEITVVASATGLAAIVEQMFDEGLIDDPDIRDSLLDKIDAAMNKIEQGKAKPAENILNALINHINAQTGKHISPEAAAILIADAEYIMANL